MTDARLEVLQIPEGSIVWLHNLDWGDVAEPRVHACPRDGEVVTACCGQTFEMVSDRITLDPALVTCDGAPKMDVRMMFRTAAGHDRFVLVETYDDGEVRVLDGPDDLIAELRAREAAAAAEDRVIAAAVASTARTPENNHGICPVCFDAGERSTVRPTSSCSETIGSNPFYDEDGNYHLHSLGYTTYDYVCSNGHQYRWRERCRCIDPTCSYGGDEQLTILSRGVADRP